MITQQLGNNIRNILNANHQPAADTAAIVTIAAPDVGKVFISMIAVSFSELATGGGITIDDGGTEKFDSDYIAAGSAFLYPAFLGSAESEVIVTLGAGGGTAVGKLYVAYTIVP